MTMTRSPGPWKIVEHVMGDPDGMAEIRDNENHDVIHAHIGTYHGETCAVGYMKTTNARHVIACFNFCQGIPLEVLENRDTERYPVIHVSKLVNRQDCHVPVMKCDKVPGARWEDLMDVLIELKPITKVDNRAGMSAQPSFPKNVHYVDNTGGLP